MRTLFEKDYLPNKLPIKINPDLTEKEMYKDPLHNHDFFEFYLITVGSCIHNINGQQQILKLNDFIIIRPGDEHVLEKYKTHCSWLNVNLSTALLNDAVMFTESSFEFKKYCGLVIPPVVHLPVTQAAFIIELCDQILSLSTSDLSYAMTNIKSLMCIVSSYFKKALDSQNEAMPIWLSKLIVKMIQPDNLAKGISAMPEISKKSYGQIHRLLKMYLGITPTEFVNQNRMNLAKKLLLTTNLTSTDIAYEIGFENLSHFYHIFKKRYGTTPQKMRECILEQNASLEQ